MNSIAIWWDKKGTGEKSPQLHLDVNIWLTKNEALNYIEFGLKFSNYETLGNIYIAFPFSVANDVFEDKVDSLSKNSELTNALFNETAGLSNDEGKFHEVKLTEKNTFHYFELNKNEDVKFKNAKDKNGAEYSIITIEPTQKNSISTVYYRFRINKVENIIMLNNENNFIIDGLFKKVGFVEININSIRKLPSDIAEKLSDTAPIIKSMNLFLMTNSHTNFLFQSQELHASRILENHIWDDYLGNKRTVEKIIAYHWKQKKMFSAYSLFIKTIYVNKKRWLLLLMIAATLFLGAVGGVGGNFITERCFDGFNFSQKTVTQNSSDEHENVTNNGQKPTKISSIPPSTGKKVNHSKEVK